MRLRLLDRYVLSELLYPFIFGIASFSSIFIASSMLYRITQYMTKYGASWDSVAWLFFYSLPEVINYTFPMSMLLASLMAFGKLSGSSEIIAMKSGGISYYRIVAPGADSGVYCQHVLSCMGRKSCACFQSAVYTRFGIPD